MSKRTKKNKNIKSVRESTERIERVVRPKTIYSMIVGSLLISFFLVVVAIFWNLGDWSIIVKAELGILIVCFSLLSLAEPAVVTD